MFGIAKVGPCPFLVAIHTDTKRKAELPNSRRARFAQRESFRTTFRNCFHQETALGHKSFESFFTQIGRADGWQGPIIFLTLHSKQALTRKFPQRTSGTYSQVLKPSQSCFVPKATIHERARGGQPDRLVANPSPAMRNKPLQ